MLDNHQKWLTKNCVRTTKELKANARKLKEFFKAKKSKFEEHACQNAVAMETLRSWNKNIIPNCFQINARKYKTGVHCFDALAKVTADGKDLKCSSRQCPGPSCSKTG